jgi:hypothetical protein
MFKFQFYHEKIKTNNYISTVMIRPKMQLDGVTL